MFSVGELGVFGTAGVVIGGLLVLAVAAYLGVLAFIVIKEVLLAITPVQCRC